MHLRDVQLCLDCDSIELKATHCPICKSASVVDLSKWILPKDQARETVGKYWNVVRHEIDEMRRRMDTILADRVLESGAEPIGVC